MMHFSITITLALQKAHHPYSLVSVVTQQMCTSQIGKDVSQPPWT